MSTLESVLDTLTKKYESIITAVDININVLKRDALYHQSLSIITIYNMSYNVNFPTKVTSRTETAIDNFISNKDSMQVNAIRIITHISDHDAQLLEIVNLKSKNKKVAKRRNRKFTDK